MNKLRRRIVQSGLAAGLAATSGVLPGVAKAMRTGDQAGTAVRILILGGTGFIGPHMVREALERGHEVSLFNRGRTNDALFPDLETLIGDRDGGLDALRGRQWDAVIDNSGYVPRHVADSTRLLSDAAAHYLFVSSIAAYASYTVANDEDSPLATMEDESVEELTAATYGPMKALAEKAAAREFGEERLTILRPTYVCGPGDRTDRYTWWLVRAMRGGEMLCPGQPADPIQIIDVRDLAAFAIDCVEKRIAGTYNTVTPPGSFTMGQLLEDALALTAADATPVRASAGFLREHGAVRQMPIWTDPDGDLGKLTMVSGKRARQQGLENRPTRETARDTLRWWKTLPAERSANLRAGPSAQREAELLGLLET